MKFPEPFFAGGDLFLGSASLRSSSKLTARERDLALGSAAIAMALNDQIGSRYALRAVNLPYVGRSASPESAAKGVRQHWRLRDGPVKDVLPLLESNGVRLYSLPADAARADSFSTWQDDQPGGF